jgi:glycine/D-amino acid oxidase-like deaminating enzyme
MGAWLRSQPPAHAQQPHPSGAKKQRAQRAENAVGLAASQGQLVIRVFAKRKVARRQALSRSMAAAADPAAEDEERVRATTHVVVIGAGVVGASIAYSLVQLQLQAEKQRLAVPRLDLTLVDAARAGINSGQADGWLCPHACDGTPVKSLAQHGFAAHAAWAQELRGSHYGKAVGYGTLQHVRYVGTVGDSYGAHSAVAPVYERCTQHGVCSGVHTAVHSEDRRLRALRPEAPVYEASHGPEASAQLSPEAWVRALVDSAEERGGGGPETGLSVRVLEGTRVRDLRMAERHGKKVVTAVQLETAAGAGEEWPGYVSEEVAAGAGAPGSRRWCETAKEAARLRQRFDERRRREAVATARRKGTQATGSAGEPEPERQPNAAGTQPGHVRWLEFKNAVRVAGVCSAAPLPLCSESH